MDKKLMVIKEFVKLLLEEDKRLNQLVKDLGKLGVDLNINGIPYTILNKMTGEYEWLAEEMENYPNDDSMDVITTAVLEHFKVWE